MCDPVTITGVALSAASAGLNAAAQSKVTNARNDALSAERIRQQGYDQEAAALNTKSQDRYEKFEPQQAAKAKSLGDFFTQQAVPQPQAAEAIAPTSSNITVQAEAAERGKAKAFTDRTGQALGELRSFGDVLGGLSRLQARDASQVGQIGGFKKGSSAVTAYELEAANSKGNGLKTFGDILGGLGKIGVGAGLSGAKLPFFGGSNVSNIVGTGTSVFSDPVRAAPTTFSLFR